MRRFTVGRPSLASPPLASPRRLLPLSLPPPLSCPRPCGRVASAPVSPQLPNRLHLADPVFPTSPTASASAGPLSSSFSFSETCDRRGSSPGPSTKHSTLVPVPTQSAVSAWEGVVLRRRVPCRPRPCLGRCRCSTELLQCHLPKRWLPPGLLLLAARSPRGRLSLEVSPHLIRRLGVERARPGERPLPPQRPFRAEAKDGDGNPSGPPGRLHPAARGGEGNKQRAGGEEAERVNEEGASLGYDPLHVHHGRAPEEGQHQRRALPPVSRVAAACLASPPPPPSSPSPLSLPPPLSCPRPCGRAASAPVSPHLPNHRRQAPRGEPHLPAGPNLEPPSALSPSPAVASTLVIADAFPSPSPFSSPLPVSPYLSGANKQLEPGQKESVHTETHQHFPTAKNRLRSRLKSANIRAHIWSTAAL